MIEDGIFIGTDQTYAGRQGAVRGLAMQDITDTGTQVWSGVHDTDGAGSLRTPAKPADILYTQGNLSIIADRGRLPGWISQEFNLAFLACPISTQELMENFGWSKDYADKILLQVRSLIPPFRSGIVVSNDESFASADLTFQKYPDLRDIYLRGLSSELDWAAKFAALSSQSGREASERAKLVLDHARAFIAQNPYLTPADLQLDLTRYILGNIIGDRMILSTSAELYSPDSPFQVFTLLDKFLQDPERMTRSYNNAISATGERRTNNSEQDLHELPYFLLTRRTDGHITRQSIAIGANEIKIGEIVLPVHQRINDSQQLFEILKTIGIDIVAAVPKAVPLIVQEWETGGKKGGSFFTHLGYLADSHEFGRQAGIKPGNEISISFDAQSALGQNWPADFLDIWSAYLGNNNQEFKAAINPTRTKDPAQAAKHEDVRKALQYSAEKAKRYWGERPLLTSFFVIGGLELIKKVERTATFKIESPISGEIFHDDAENVWQKVKQIINTLNIGVSIRLTALDPDKLSEELGGQVRQYQGFSFVDTPITSINSVKKIQAMLNSHSDITVNGLYLYKK